jgi:hypothetical protein
VWRPGLRFEDFESGILDLARLETGRKAQFDVAEYPLFQLALAAAIARSLHGTRNRREPVGSLNSTPKSGHGSSRRERLGIMRRRLGRLLPIVMFAMLVQIFAPIAACQAFSVVGVDPLAGAICSHANDAGSPQDGQTDHQQTHGACCTLCCVVHTATATTDPQAFAVNIERDAAAVIWRDMPFGLPPIAVDSNAQARGPPAIS